MMMIMIIMTTIVNYNLKYDNNYNYLFGLLEEKKTTT